VNFDNFFKITGRYWLNEDFIYDDFAENNEHLEEDLDNPNISLRFLNSLFNIMLIEKTENHTIYNFYIIDELLNYDIVHMDFNIKFCNKTDKFIQIYEFISEKKEYEVITPLQFYNELVIELYNNKCETMDLTVLY
jgi:hypothetical protein